MFNTILNYNFFNIKRNSGIIQSLLKSIPILTLQFIKVMIFHYIFGERGTIEIPNTDRELTTLKTLIPAGVNTSPRFLDKIC